jgi:hypothetical protein
MGDSDDDLSSDDEPETAKEVKASDIVLSQMRRGAQKRGGQSKLKARYEVNTLSGILFLFKLYSICVFDRVYKITVK